MRWPEDAETIAAWARGDTVDVDTLVAELLDWEDYLASTAALWPDSTVAGATIRTGGTP